MLLAAPEGRRIETINDFDGFVANFWRAVSHDPDAVAHAADWPVNEVDLFARHSWLVRQRATLTEQLHADPAYYDARIAGWWVWGACKLDWLRLVQRHRPLGTRWRAHRARRQQRRARHQPPAAAPGQRRARHQPPAAAPGQRRAKASTASCRTQRWAKWEGSEHPRTVFIRDWMRELHERLRDACDLRRLAARVPGQHYHRHGLTAIFLDPPYEKGDMDYSAGGMGLGIAHAVRDWCATNGHNPQLRIVLCGHAGEHDALLAQGWHTRSWKAGGGYALTDRTVANRKSETLWCSPALRARARRGARPF